MIALHPLRSVNDEVTGFFEKLGYTTTWDFKRATGEYWYEIEDEEGLVCQIDMGVPLADIVEDMTAWYKGRDTSTNGRDYTVNLPRGRRDELLLKRVVATK